jgi:uncharacterized Zn-binding protein involved in type VI secretion
MGWTVEGKEVIRVGDSTTHGGKVLTGSPNTFYGKAPIARVGDLVSCPKCEGEHRIVSGASRTFDHQKPIARDGDLVSCGAKLIGSSTIGNSNQYDEQIVAVDDTGNPIAFYPYFIKTEDGKTYTGRTDEEGRTLRIITNGKQILTTHWGEEAILLGSR